MEVLESEMATQTAVEKYKKLRAEADKFLEDAKTAALEKANEAVAVLNSLGFFHVLTEGEAPKKKKGTRGKSNLPPKFRHPTDPSLTWAGKGRTPLWMTELIEKGEGKAKGDFLNPERG